MGVMFEPKLYFQSYTNVYMNGFDIIFIISRFIEFLRNYLLLVPKIYNYYKIKNLKVFDCWVWTTDLKFKKLRELLRGKVRCMLLYFMYSYYNIIVDDENNNNFKFFLKFSFFKNK
jgi:hypothetical protein